MEEFYMNGLHVTVRGEGSPLLMIHGIISDGSFFDACSEILAEDFKVITYDRRGYGKSDETVFKDFSVAAQAEDAAAVMRATCSEPAWILGNSAGGLISLELALRYPELIRGMVLVEPSIGFDQAERQKILEWNKELNGYVTEGKVKKALRAFGRVVGGSVGGGKTSLREMAQVFANLENFMYGELNEVQRYVPDLDKTKKLPVPVVIAVTELGRDGIFATSSASAAEILGWPLMTLPGYHNVAKEQPEEFAEKLQAAFAKMEL